MGTTEEVLYNLGILDLLRKLKGEVLVLDNLETRQWKHCNFAGIHWKSGFLIAKIFTQYPVIQTCCLKTHRFGGHFTLSLKNSIGMIAKYHPETLYNYMAELHSSKHMRKMIAEVNLAYTPVAVILDATQGFSTGGPERGRVISPGAILASTDRVAVDACGVALLRIHGTTREVAEGEIFRLEQIARAVEIGIGVKKPEDIELVPLDAEAERLAERIEEMLGNSSESL